MTRSSRRRYGPASTGWPPTGAAARLRGGGRHRRPDVRDRRPGVDRLAGPGDAGGGHRGGIEGPRQYSSTELAPELYEHILNPRPFQEVHRLFKFIRVAARFPRPLATELSQLRQEFRLVARQPG